jgi:hypothetical protein
LLFGCSATPDEDDDPDIDTAPPPLSEIRGLHVTEIAAYQAVKVSLVGQATTTPSPIPLVEGRAALVRAFVTTDTEYDGGEVTARLHLGDEAPMDVTIPVAVTSSDADLATSLNFEIPQGALAAGSTLQLEVGRVGAGAPPQTIPADAPLQLPVASAGSSLKVQLVPVAYAADGSGRLPDTSDAQVAVYHDAILAMYPAPAVELSVRQPLQWGQPVSALGNGWDQLLMAIADLRQKDGAPPDLYYYGVFSPAPSFGGYCAGGCVAGLSMAGSPHDAFSRASIGLGFAGQDAALIAVHEIGHAHGRMHAPCQTFDSDPGYPHSGGRIGVWGYDGVAKRLYAPETPDVMGYCTPQWISDYTFVGLFERVRVVNQASWMPAGGGPRTYARVRVGGDDGDAWLEPILLDFPPSAQPVTVELTGGGERRQIEGQYYPFDHIAGGVLLFHEGGKTTDAMRVRVAGRTVSLSGPAERHRRHDDLAAPASALDD